MEIMALTASTVLDERIVNSDRKGHTQDATNTKALTVIMQHTHTHTHTHTHSYTQPLIHTYVREQTFSHIKKTDVKH